MKQIRMAKEALKRSSSSISSFNAYMNIFFRNESLLKSGKGVKETERSPGIYTVSIAPWVHYTHGEKMAAFREATKCAKKINETITPEDRKALKIATFCMLLTLRLNTAKKMGSAIASINQASLFKEEPQAEGKL